MDLILISILMIENKLKPHFGCETLAMPKIGERRG
jgi:hypothetical protein